MGMRRFLALAVALIALLAAGFLWTRDRPVAVATETAIPAIDVEGDDETAPLVAPVSSVTPADREARRFSRYDRDRNAAVSRDEYMASRHKAFARLDSDGDGRLGFAEYAVATAKKFGKADRDADGVLDADEFAVTAPRKRAAPACNCAR